MSNSMQKSQWLWVVAIVLLTVVLVVGLLLSNKKDTHAEGETEHSEQKVAEHASESEGVEFSAAQIQQQGIQLAQVTYGEVKQSVSYPATLLVNTDQQAHVSPSFSGRVEQVNVELGQQVKRGQALATLFVPDVVDQQASLSMAQQNLQLAEQDYQRERQLWQQGISAKQDYQRAYSAYRQAQIAVQAARSRLSAYGVNANSRGRYVLYAPISGVISNKDLVVGENVQLSDQLFTIDQLGQLWLEFVLPSSAQNLQPEQKIQFKSLQTSKIFQAQIQSLSTEADKSSGRLKVRAKVLEASNELRPNLMVNVLFDAEQPKQVLRVAKTAVQQLEGKNVVFMAKAEKDKTHFQPAEVQLGTYSSDGQWVEILSGLNAEQHYVSAGSFVLKSEMEKGEVEHGH
ncbi:efflux transporter periplasmic adaptor subunit [Serratia sp. S1B]|nr:efflux transporter periplasmic adaptor subunit [Serratia sp. S1B]